MANAVTKLRSEPMTKELVVELRYAAGDYSLFDKHMGNDAADIIERLEDELLAATIRIDNDARTIESLTQERDAAIAESLEQARLLDINSEHGAALLSRADDMQARIDVLMAGFSKATDELFALSQDDGKVERALDRANTEIKRLHAELDALKNQEPYGFWWEADGTFNIGQEPSMSTKAGPCSGWKITPLFLAPGAQPVKTGRAMVPKESS
jgi:hypothetical protein